MDAVTYKRMLAIEHAADGEIHIGILNDFVRSTTNCIYFSPSCVWVANGGVLRGISGSGSTLEDAIHDCWKQMIDLDSDDNQYLLRDRAGERIALVFDRDLQAFFTKNESLVRIGVGLPPLREDN